MVDAKKTLSQKGGVSDQVMQPKQLMLHGDEGVLLEDHPYLFRCRHHEDCFLNIQKEMAMLNDFCVVIKDASDRHSHSMNADEYEDPVEAWEVEHMRALTGYSAKSVGKLFSPASSMVLLYLFLIKSLRSINISYNSDMFRVWRSNNNSPEVIQLIELLEKRFEISFGIIQDQQMQIVLFRTVRRIRNNFTHGDWDKVDDDLQKVNPVMAFGLVSKLLNKIQMKHDYLKTGDASFNPLF